MADDSVDYGSLVDEQQGGQGPAVPGTPAPPVQPRGGNEYLSLIDGARESSRSMVQGSMFVASQRKDPARWAKVTELADRTKLPPDVVDRNFDVVHAADERNRNDYESLISSTPGLAQWLRNPDNATVAKDEFAPLARVDRGAQILAAPTQDDGILSTMGRGFARSGRAIATGFNDMEAAAGHLAVGAGLASPEATAEFVANANRRAAQLRAQMPDYAKDFSQAMEQHGGDLERAFLTFSNIQDELHRGEILKALKDYGIGAVRTTGELLDMIGAAAARPRGLLLSTIEGVPSMAPALVGGTAGTLAGGAIGGPVGAVAGLAGGTFLGMAPVNVGSEINAELQRRGVDVTNAQSLLAAYRDPQLMADIRAKAERSGVTSAAIAAMMTSFAGKLTSVAKAAGASKLVQGAAAAADVGTQAAGMGAADVGGQIAGGKGDLSKVDVSRAAQAAISMLGYGVGETALGASRRAMFPHDPVRAATEVGEQAMEALRAQRDAQALQEIGDALKEAPTTTSLPERVKELVETASGGRDAATVYFQTKDWDEHFQSVGASPAKAAADILGDDGRAYFEARATGAPMAIPLGDYVSKVGSTDHWNGLLTSARTRPDGMSLAEAHQYLESLPATMNDLAKEVSGEPVPAEQSAAAVGEDVRRQLRGVGVDERAAETNAKIWESAFKTLGARTGTDPQELYRRFNVRIGKEETPVAPPGPTVNLQEVADRAIAVREAQAERAALAGEEAPLTPYDAKPLERDLAARTSDNQFVYARTESGALRGNLKNVHTDGLVDELSQLLKAQNEDANKAVPTLVPDENMHTFNDQRAYVGYKTAAVNAKGRMASRNRAIARIEAELSRRGVEDIADRVWQRFTGESKATEFTAFQTNIKPYMAWAGAAADESNSPEVRAYAAEKAKAIEPVARAEHAGEIADANAEYEMRTGQKWLYQQKPGERLGRITIGEHGVDIKLLDDADLSTFLHETGHFYLHLLDQLAHASDLAGDASQIKADWAKTLDFLGAKEGEPLTREQHEQWARGFEAYLMEGKAPSTELRGVFSRFRAWLVGLYKSLDNLRVFLSDDVRGVFDRLLASDEEIRNAEEQQHMEPLFPDPVAVGMNPDQARDYQTSVQAARQAAEEELTHKLVAEVRREQDSVYKAERTKVRTEVATEVNQERDYLAQSLMARGTLPDGSALPSELEPFKLSRQALADEYASRYPDLLNRLRRQFLYTKEGGVHPDMAAEILGFSSGDELIRAMLNLHETAKQRIEHLTDARMRENGPNLLSPTELPLEAAKAVQNEKRAGVLRKELEILASDHLATLKGLVKAITKPVPPSAAIREQAVKILAGKQVRDIKPNVFERTAAGAAMNARDLLLKGDVDGAFDAKLRQLLNLELARAASDAKESIEKALDGFKDVFGRDERLSERRDMDLVNTARAILSSFGIGKSDKPPFAYLEQMHRYDPEMYDTVVDMVNEATTAAGDFNQLTYEQFQALNETVSSLWSLSRRTKQIEIEGKKLDRADVEKDLGARLDELSTPGPKAGYTKAVTNWEKTKYYLMGARAFLRRAEMWVDAMDSGKPDGVFRKYVLNPVFEGATKYRLAKRAELLKYLDIVKPIEKGVKTGTIAAPELGYTFRGRAELLGALLHTGNASNLQKLLRGRHWGDFDEFGNLDRSRWDAFVQRMHAEGVLTKADYDYAQGTWDLFDGLKADAQRAHKEIYGHYFSEITAQPFDMPFGHYRGGYYPALTDNFIVADQALRREQESFLQGQNGFMFPTTGRGFTKQRTEAYARPLTLDAATVPLGIDAVLRFTHIEPRVRDVARIVMSRGFRPQLDNFDPTIGKEMLVPWLQRAAQQRTQMPGMFKGADIFWREVRNRTGMQILTANVVVALEQITHMPGAAIKVPPTKLASALWRYIRAPKQVAEAVHEKSDYMRVRETAAVMEIQKSIDSLMLDPSKYDKARGYMQEHGYFLSRAVQSISDHMTWTGAYEHAVEQGASEIDAVRQADSAVRETQGAYEPESLSRFETSTPFIRAFSMFYSFFNAKANLLGSEFATTIRDLGLRKGAGRLLYVYAFGFMASAAMTTIVKNAASGQKFDEDDDGPIDDVFRLFFESQLEMATRMVPIVGPVAQTAVGAFTKKPSDDDINVSPAVKMIEAAVHAPGDVYRAVHDRMVTSKAITDVLTLLGLITGLPLAPLAKPIAHAHDVHIGKARPLNKLDLVRGLLTGRSGAR